MTAPEAGDFYELLDLDPDADEDAVRQAILDQRRTWVRRQNAPTVERQRQAEDRVRQIAAAEETLLDKDRRAAYDRTRRTPAPGPARVVLTKPAAATPPPAGPSPSTPPDAAATVPGPAPAPDPAPAPRIDWMARGTEALRRGDLRAARYAATEAAERNPGDPAAWLLRGTVSRTDNRLDDAIYEFVEAGRLAPSASTYLSLAEVNEAAGYVDQARAGYESAVRLDPAAAGPTIALANFWVRRAEPQTAVDVLTPALARHPADPAVANALGFALLYRVDSYLTMLHDGSHVFTSPAQIHQARTDLHYALSLPLTDADLTERLGVRVDQAGLADRKAWSFPAGVGCSGVGLRILGWLGLILLALVAIPGLFRNSAGLGGLVLIAAVALIVWGFVRVYRRPRWSANRNVYRYQVARWGI
ncbi:hypothetical protein [Nakamurella sp.]|uniref:tetratricopeptide repeat protein n=1 Tax=Nakamurella sp. TaxID=1869182 RepID=UPI003B3BD768